MKIMDKKELILAKKQWLKEFKKNPDNAKKKRNSIDRKIAKLYISWVCEKCANKNSLKVYHKSNKYPPRYISNIKILCDKCYKDEIAIKPIKNKKELEKEKSNWSKKLKKNFNKSRKERVKIDRKIAMRCLPWICERCGSEKNLEVHHKSWKYPPRVLSNLRVLCKKCHDELHVEENILPHIKYLSRKLELSRSLPKKKVEWIKNALNAFYKLKKVDPKINKVKKLQDLSFRLGILYYDLKNL
ncbi:MAG: hypothetical protein CVU78_00830 [Elusimicrobia bacterium HGW-Elusimicrobia-2]|nr:MAG: hypothetical protein CVU78_00830 [Elusimicrobia bacterium HGW-Elusimicrobia-2]